MQLLLREPALIYLIPNYISLHLFNFFLTTGLCHNLKSGLFSTIVTIATIFYIYNMSHSPSGTDVYIMNKYFLSSDLSRLEYQDKNYPKLKMVQIKSEHFKNFHNYLSNYILCKLVCWM